MVKSLRILEALTKSNVLCLMCYISGKEIILKMFLQKKNPQITPVHIFLSGSGSTGKSHLVKTIYQVVSKELLYHFKEPDKPRVLLLGPTGISAVNICVTTIHCGHGIKPGVKLLGLSDKIKASLRNKLSEVKMVIADKFSMVSNDLFLKINARLLEIFICSTAVEFAGLTVVLVADLLQLPPVMGKPVYVTVDGCVSLERHLGLHLWRMFQFAELTEVMRQRGDTKFIDLLNKMRVGNVDEDVRKQIRERFLKESDINYPEKHCMCMLKDNRKILDKLPSKTYTINAIDQIPADFKYPATLISLALDKKQPETGGLANRLELKVGAKVMVTVNVDIQDMLLNGQIGEVAGFEIMNSIVKKFCLKFQDPLVGRTAMLSDHSAQQNCFVPLQKCDADIPVCKCSISPSIKRTQFPLMLSWACTIHTVQGLSLEGVVNFNLQKKRT